MESSKKIKDEPPVEPSFKVVTLMVKHTLSVYLNIISIE